MSLPYESAASVVVVLLTGVAAVTDARSGRIPNRLTLPTLLLAPVIFAVFGGLSALVSSVLGSVICGLGPWALYRVSAARGIGGGDVKLFAAIGALVGPTLGLEIQLVSFIAVLVIAFGQLAYRGLLFRTLKNALFIALNGFLPKRLRRPVVAELLSELRMGIPILVATVIALAVRHPEWWA